MSIDCNHLECRNMFECQYTPMFRAMRDGIARAFGSDKTELKNWYVQNSAYPEFRVRIKIKPPRRCITKGDRKRWYFHFFPDTTFTRRPWVHRLSYYADQSQRLRREWAQDFERSPKMEDVWS